MDLIFRGDNGIAINPDYLFIKSFTEDYKKYYNIRACYNAGDNWVRITKNYESYDEVIDAYRTIYNRAIEIALGLNLSRDLKEEK